MKLFILKRPQETRAHALSAPRLSAIALLFVLLILVEFGLPASAQESTPRGQPSKLTTSGKDTSGQLITVVAEGNVVPIASLDAEGNPRFRIVQVGGNDVKVYENALFFRTTDPIIVHPAEMNIDDREKPSSETSTLPKEYELERVLSPSAYLVRPLSPVYVGIQSDPLAVLSGAEARQVLDWRPLYENATVKLGRDQVGVFTYRLVKGGVDRFADPGAQPKGSTAMWAPLTENSDWALVDKLSRTALQQYLAERPEGPFRSEAERFASALARLDSLTNAGPELDGRTPILPEQFGESWTAWTQTKTKGFVGYYARRVDRDVLLGVSCVQTGGVLKFDEGGFPVPCGETGSIVFFDTAGLWFDLPKEMRVRSVRDEPVFFAFVLDRGLVHLSGMGQLRMTDGSILDLADPEVGADAKLAPTVAQPPQSRMSGSVQPETNATAPDKADFNYMLSIAMLGDLEKLAGAPTMNEQERAIFKKLVHTAEEHLANAAAPKADLQHARERLARLQEFAGLVAPTSSGGEDLATKHPSRKEGGQESAGPVAVRLTLEQLSGSKFIPTDAFASHNEKGVTQFDPWRTANDQARIDCIPRAFNTSNPYLNQLVDAPSVVSLSCSLQDTVVGTPLKYSGTVILLYRSLPESLLPESGIIGTDSAFSASLGLTPEETFMTFDRLMCEAVDVSTLARAFCIPDKVKGSWSVSALPEFSILRKNRHPLALFPRDTRRTLVNYFGIDGRTGCPLLVFKGLELHNADQQGTSYIADVGIAADRSSTESLSFWVGVRSDQLTGTARLGTRKQAAVADGGNPFVEWKECRSESGGLVKTRGLDVWAGRLDCQSRETVELERVNQ